jgi:hypothetical protein
MRRYITIVAAVLTMLAVSQQGVAQETSYLILENIGAFIIHNQSRAFPDRKLRPITPFRKYNGSGGILNAIGHFVYDHNDVTYETGYDNSIVGMGLSVTVTQHYGSESDKWLAHEIDIEFRNYYGIPGYYIKTINGNTVYVYGAGGRDYRWLSGNKVVMIEYHDLQLTKPEPLEVIQAYLAKHPSTLPAITTKDVMSTANKIPWIKEEMERRLWLCDKWFMQLQLKKAEEKLSYQESVKSMNIFLDYREKYHGIKADDEKNALAAYVNTNNGTGIKARLMEYKNWWTVHKGDAISIQ